MEAIKVSRQTKPKARRNTKSQIEVAQFAAAVGVTPVAVYGWIKKGKAPGVAVLRTESRKRKWGGAVRPVTTLDSAMAPIVKLALKPAATERPTLSQFAKAIKRSNSWVRNRISEGGLPGAPEFTLIVERRKAG